MNRYVVLILLLTITAPALAGNALITWTNPTTYSDGSPMPASELAHTLVERGTCSGPGVFGALLESTQVPAPAQSLSVVALEPGTYCWRLASVTIRGKTSDYSVTRSKTIDWPTPSAPDFLDVVVSFSIMTPGGVVELPAGETFLIPGVGIVGAGPHES